MVPQPTQPSTDRTRRGVIKACAVALAAGITASTSGCLSSLPPLGQKQTYGRVDVPTPDEPTYRSWLPAPTTFDHVGSHYTVTYAQPSPIEGNEPEEFIERRGTSKTNLDYFGIGYENYGSCLQCDFGTVIEAEFGASTVADTLTRSGYEPDGSDREYDLFSRSDVSRRAAVRDGTIVWSSRRIHEHPDIEALIDTEAGERQRYHDVSPSFERISGAIGASRTVIIGPDFGSLTERAELAAIGFRFADGGVYQVIDLLFREGEVPTVEEFERGVRGVEEWTDEANAFDSGIDGRLASIGTRVPRRSGGERTPFTDPPQVTWGASYDAEAESLTIRHEAGEAIDAGLLRADINPEAGPGDAVTPGTDIGPESASDGDVGSGTRTRGTAPIRSQSQFLGAIESLWEGGERVTPGDVDTIALDTATPPPSGQTIDPDDVSRVDILLAEHRSDTIPDLWRLFAYELG